MARQQQQHIAHIGAAMILSMFAPDSVVADQASLCLIEAYLLKTARMECCCNKFVLFTTQGVCLCPLNCVELRKTACSIDGATVKCGSEHHACMCEWFSFNSRERKTKLFPAT